MTSRFAAGAIARCFLLVIAVLWAGILSGCNVTPPPQADNNTAPPSAIATPLDSQPEPTASSPFGAAPSLPSATAARVKAALSDQTGIAPGDMTLSRVQSQTWNNGCLGAAQPDEFCAEVITPGYEVTVSTPEGQYQLHTDEAGEHLRVVDSQE